MFRYWRPSSARRGDPRQFGRWGEKQAVKALKRRGYRIIQTNYRSALGEIDIIARDGDVLVFVEVKARRSSSHGPPAESVTPRKRRQISHAAAVFLKKHRMTHVNVRFDVVSVDLTPEGQTEIIQDAFPATIF
ncbi:MAG: YraN family protein [Deltaproteobacteria bacterium]|nr:YraN family protein [Deltaproteobacteria bacterium]MBW2306845.1 YraN family protein [Deltaproteobacteria bacterium]